MGCCGSSEANAAESELPPPERGQTITVCLCKKFMSADYNVRVNDEEGEIWMLIDAVGSFWDDGYKYYLKHRAPGQVDESGEPTSTTLGAVNLQGDWDGFGFQVCGADRDTDCGPFIDFWDGDIDWGVSSEKQLWATWGYSKRAVIYSDFDMTNQIGWLDITGSGTWFDEEVTRIVYDTDDDGSETIRHETDHNHRIHTNGFQYEFNVYNCPMVIRSALSHGQRWVPRRASASDRERTHCAHTGTLRALVASSGRAS